MKRYRIAALLFFILPLCLGATDIHYESNLIIAKKRAAAEGKLVMIAFGAKWCLPCRIMEEHAFSDPRVKEQLSNSYVPVKVDVDDFDGYAHKQVFSVTSIPTIVLLDSRGNSVLKYEESMTATQLADQLVVYDTPGNKVVAGPPLAARPSRNTNPNPPISTDAPSVINQTAPSTPQPSVPHYEVNPAPTPAITYQQTRPEPTPSNPEPVRPPAPAPRPAPSTAPAPSTDPILSNEGLYELSAVRIEMKGFSVQTNAFSEQDNMILQVEQFKKAFPNEKILVNISSDKNGKTWFKLMVGHFDSRGEANSLVNQFIQQGMSDVFLKDLSSLKYEGTLTYNSQR